MAEEATEEAKNCKVEICGEDGGKFPVSEGDESLQEALYRHKQMSAQYKRYNAIQKVVKLFAVFTAIAVIISLGVQTAVRGDTIRQIVFCSMLLVILLMIIVPVVIRQRQKERQDVTTVTAD